VIDSISFRKAQKQWTLKTDTFNLIIGRSGTGKTLFLQSLFASICHYRTGVPLEEIRAQMNFSGDAYSDVQWTEPFSGTVFYMPPCDAYFMSQLYTELPLHIRKTFGVYRSFVKRGVDFAHMLREQLGIDASHGGLLKTKVFMAVLQEINPGDIVLVDMPEAGLDAIVWKWWLDRLAEQVENGIQVFLTTHDFFVYTYARTRMRHGKIFYMTPDSIGEYDIHIGIPEDAPILRVPLEVLESAM